MSIVVCKLFNQTLFNHTRYTECKDIQANRKILYDTYEMVITNVMEKETELLGKYCTLPMLLKCTKEMRFVLCDPLFQLLLKTSNPEYIAYFMAHNPVLQEYPNVFWSHCTLRNRYLCYKTAKVLKNSPSLIYSTFASAANFIYNNFYAIAIAITQVVARAALEAAIIHYTSKQQQDYDQANYSSPPPFNYKYTGNSDSSSRPFTSSSRTSSRPFTGPSTSSFNANSNPSIYSQHASHFQALNLTPTDINGKSTTDMKSTVKSAYRKMAKQFHPDKHKDKDFATEKFKEINNAHNHLNQHL